MQTTKLKRIMSCILCIVLIAAMALFTTGCNGNTTSNNESTVGTQLSQESGKVLGQGTTEFFLVVATLDGKETRYTIHTDKKTVGEALLELKLIDGDNSAYGLFVKTVDGIRADYELDKTYWAFYEDGKYAATGVDSTDIIPGRVYTLKVEKS